jgi:SNF2 family DNA or RNA helicase
MILTCVELMSKVEWDYIILDEGHKIRNHNAKASKAVNSVTGQHKLLLSGTPIMNNLRVLLDIIIL